MYDLTIGIVSYHDLTDLSALIDSIHTYTKGITYRILVVDNGEPGHETAAFLREAYPEITTLCSLNRGFGAAHNLLIPYMDSKYHLVLNPDILLTSNILLELVQYMDAHPECALLTPRVYDREGVEQCLPKRSPTYRYLILGRLAAKIKFLKKYREEYARVGEDFHSPTPVDFCSGCFLFTRSEYYKKIGGFDEDYFLYLEDADFTERMQNLGSTLFYPDASVTHNWKAGSRKNLKLFLIHLRSMFLYMRKKRKNRRQLEKLRRVKKK